MDARQHAADLQRPQLIVTRVIGAPLRLVFDAWTKPEHLAHWWGPAGFSLVSWEVDCRIGGNYQFWMRPPQGLEYWVRGTYVGVVDMERIVFTWNRDLGEGAQGPASLVMVRFVAEGERTKLTLRHAGFQTAEARDEHQTAWEESLARLVDYGRTLRVWRTTGEFAFAPA